jgi:hypothetical protein
VSFEIREATAQDAPEIRRLLARVFGLELPVEEWQWKFVLDPDGWFGIVAVLDGQIVGNYAGWAMRFLSRGEERLLYSVGDVATDPGVRFLGGRRGVYRSMAGAFYEAVGSRGVPFCFGFPNARALEVSHRIVGSRTLFRVWERRVPCEAFPAPPPDSGSGDSLSETFDPLWTAASRFLTEAAVRDRERANWRFHARPTRYYRMVWRETAEEMQGWAVLSVVGENALVADYLGQRPDGSDLPPLFAAAAAEAARMGARRLVFWETPGGPGSRVIARLDGERREAGFPLIVRTFDEEAANEFARSVHLVPALYDVI